MSAHVVPVRTYLLVFASLMVLTFLTVAASPVSYTHLRAHETLMTRVCREMLD